VAEIIENEFKFIFFYKCLWLTFFEKKNPGKIRNEKKVARSGAFPPDPGKPLADNYKFVFFGTR
jgi:hypothetical protein